MKKKILKVLLLILINNIFFSNITFAIFNDKICVTNDDTFLGKSKKDASLYLFKNRINKVKQIYVDFLKPDDYLKNILIINKKFNRIPKHYKKYSKVNIKVLYDNVTCNFSGEARINGSTISNIDSNLLISSLRVRIIDGHINHIKDFSLKIGDVDDFKNDVFVSTFFEKLNFLSPYRFITDVKINNSEVSKFLFIESPSLEMSKNQNRNNGVFVSTNRNNWFDPKTPYKHRRSIVLSRLKNSDGIEIKNKEVILDAIDKINFIYLNSLGIGDGKNCCKNSKLNDSTDRMYFNGDIFLRYKNLHSRLNYFDKILQYEHLLHIVDGYHGLALEDRIFFYNPMLDEIEPVYNELEPKNIFEYPIYGTKNYLKLEYRNQPRLTLQHKSTKNDLVLLIKNLNIENFNQELNIRGLKINKNQTEYIINKILSSLINFDNYKEIYHDNNFTKNYFKKHFNSKNLNFKLAFNGKNNLFEICNISLKNCRMIKLNNDLFYKLLSEKFLLLKEENKEITYIRQSKKSYTENHPPKNKGIFTMKYYDLGEFGFYYNFDSNRIFYDDKEKRISVALKNKYDKIIFYKNKIKNLKINISGPDKLETIDFKRDKNMLGGCINFVKSEIINLNIEINNANCAKAIEIIQSYGNIETIYINSAAFDALDAEMSELNFNHINILNVNGDCIGFKRGSYKIKKAKLQNCSDKAISYGEHSDGEIDKLYVKNSKVGLYVKDSSKLNLLSYRSLNNQYCIMLINLKKNYFGSILNLKEDNFKCNKKEIFYDNFSQLNFLN